MHLEENIDPIVLGEFRQTTKTLADVLDALVALNFRGEVVAEDSDAFAANILGKLDEVLGAVDDDLPLLEIW